MIIAGRDSAVAAATRMVEPAGGHALLGGWQRQIVVRPAAERGPGKERRLLATDVTAKPKVLLLDNYDSFTFNLFHRLGELGADVEVVRNDALTPEEALARPLDAVVISPGPCDPDRAGISLALIERAAKVCPVLGVCLGHQAIGQVFGSKVVRAPAPMHGKVSPIHHDGTGMFAGLVSPFPATRYHSLVIERSILAPGLVINAWTEDGLIMGVRHERLPVHGVQFHPESIETDAGYGLLGNFLALVQSGMPRLAGTPEKVGGVA